MGVRRRAGVLGGIVYLVRRVRGFLQNRERVAERFEFFLGSRSREVSDVKIEASGVSFGARGWLELSAHVLLIISRTLSGSIPLGACGVSFSM